MRSDKFEKVRPGEYRLKEEASPQQDVFQARVEIGRERDRRLALEESRHIAVARINPLMHRAPENPLSLSRLPEDLPRTVL